MFRHRSPMIIFVLFVAGIFLYGCAGQRGEPGPVGPAGAAGPMGPVGPPGEDASASQEYIGADACGQCHEDQFNSFMLSGHPHDLTKIENGQPPVFPYDSETGGVTEPPDGFAWEDVSYVVGGYGWKALFVDQDGYVITGDETALTQYNFAHEGLDMDASWSAYPTDEEKVPFDCAVCHTTGYAPQGHQENMDGIVGTWDFEGVQCEVCHGPGSRHAEDPRGVRMVLDRSSQLCGECHTRGARADIAARDGFEDHNQQFSDLYNSKHFALSCVTCHDPHSGTVFVDEENNPNQGINQVCQNCHWPELHQNHERHFKVTCIDCHMPPMALSAVGDLTRFKADIRSHQFSINTNPEAAQFSEDGTTVMPYITLEYTCKQCHNGEDFSDRDLAELAAVASGYHDPPTPTPVPSPTPEPTLEPEGTPEATPTS